MPSERTLTITILYDNHPYDSRLTPAWGFSALVEYHGHNLLFDAGGDGKILMENMRILGVDPTRIDRVVLSHAHSDHTGGLMALLNAGVKPIVFLPASFPDGLKRQVAQFTQVREITQDQSLSEGFWTTGELGEAIPELALVVETAQGLVVVTGCAHPGIVAMIEKVRDRFSDPVVLVLGGFHLGSKNEVEVIAILEDFRRLSVEQVAPCHCTGEYAIKMLASEYGNDFIQVGVGSVIQLDTTTGK
jgi:7,8-dihydropterin-6-yl-methyl-4-(beta-D-ribofuranosyl)aminobenzene 5'-phosphate synthase